MSIYTCMHTADYPFIKRLLDYFTLQILRGGKVIRYMYYEMGIQTIYALLYVILHVLATARFDKKYHLTAIVHTTILLYQ